MSDTLAPTLAAVTRLRQVRRRGYWLRIGALVIALSLAFVAALMIGDKYIPASKVLHVLWGDPVPGASFVIGTLRLPRALLAVLVGASFGLGGAAFQTLLRNPLASPDIIGIGAAAGTAAVFGITVWGLQGAEVAPLAIAFSLIVAAVIYLLAWRDGVTGARLILIGIGISAILQSLTAYMLGQAMSFNLQEAFRWLTGSLNGAAWGQIAPVAVTLGVAGPVLLLQARGLDAVGLGDDLAAALGIRVGLLRMLVILSAVLLIAFATAATGPIAFIPFLSGPIAMRLIGGRGNPMLAAALIGALLVLTADLAGQFAFPNRYPVGVITGVIGAPCLIWMMLRQGRRTRMP